MCGVWFILTDARSKIAGTEDLPMPFPLRDPSFWPMPSGETFHIVKLGKQRELSFQPCFSFCAGILKLV